MRRLILGMFISLDGFICGPKGETDWIFRSGDDATDAWIIDKLRQAGALAMGSRAFRGMASYWPDADTPFAAPMNAVPKIVFSRSGPAGLPEFANLSAERGSWANPVVADGDLADEIARLKAEPGKDVRALGGAEFAQALAASDLVDEYHLLVCPVVLGSGTALFSKLEAPRDLMLVTATPFSAGAIALEYRRA